MVDFTQRTAKKKTSKPIDPIELYNGLDRASDKGPLRPVQDDVLTEWHQSRRNDRDLILKLHTGQGKTLIGLVVLVSKLNEGKGPALYLCPNQYLVDQTVAQAEAFGVPYVTADDGIPPQFTDGQAVLIALVHKLFNGRTQFGVGLKGEPVRALVMDDCHACIDTIQGQTRITLDDKSSAFQPLLDLFAGDLEAQRPGTFAEVRQGHYDAIIEVPYWAWVDRLEEVTEILMKYRKGEADLFSVARAERRSCELPLYCLRQIDRDRTVRAAAASLPLLRKGVAPCVHVGHGERRFVLDQGLECARDSDSQSARSQG